MSLRQDLLDLEKMLISEALRLNNWNVQKSADSLGVLRTTLWEKIKRHGMSRPDKKWRRF